MSFASKDSDTHRYHPSRWSPEQLERQKSIWKKEQGLIASLVEVHEDPTPNSRDGTNIIAEDRPWFRRVLPLHAELDSSSPSPGTDAESCDNNPTNGDDDDKDDDERRYYYGGVDVSFPNPNTAIRRAKSGGAGAIPSPSLSVAVYVVLDSRTLEVVYRDHEWYDAEAVPYVPTFLAAREIDPLETLVRRQLSGAPDRTPRAILVDGNGSFHPRGAGIACCLGVRTGLPTIGIGKSLLNVPLPLPLPSEEENGPHPDRTADEEPAEPLTTGKDNENGDAAAVSDQHRDENGDATDNHCWTRELLDARIDDFLERVHGAFFGGNGNDNGNGNENNRDGRDSAAPWAPQESPGLILGKPAPTAPRHRQKLATGKHRKERIDRKDLLKDLAPVCNGIAIPLECRSATTTTTTGSCGNRSNNNCNTADDANGNNSVILGTALVGHGGLGRHGTKPTTATKSKSNPKTKPRKDPGTAKPIVVSVGHGMSLLEATRIAASLSRVRIPEPVRIADLRGRELIREREEEDARKKRAGVGA